ncbi:hypothetical protein B0T25DRAFT_344013 [Lasiosphaeria hispida]|uniref:Peptidase A2 domain-containing protein n=1 Tax=Lasiosphaeria hispida TaxID=260671 RepID=A0AAJ0H6E9_9PEZI|nr:hypothetical protein B0T25DRAFT_344013 [Lasiosphaeria hispida]
MSSDALPKLPVPLTGLVNHLDQNPDTPLTELIEPFRKYEAHLRRTFAQDPKNELLKDPHVNVMPLYTDGAADIKIRARDLAQEKIEEKSKYIMPLPKDVRRPDRSPAIVPTFKEFHRNFNVFSESSLVELDWDNVVAAGSSVVNCLLPVPDEYASSKRSLRQFYHEKFCPASDVDLFLYGLTEAEAIEKIKQIETRVRDVLLTETTTVRTKHAITICSQYPTRHIQIVLRIYNSVSEILTGFDIDCSGAAYDGKQVYCTPRALQSYITQINHIDLTRRSPSYENRLSKYSHRGFEVYWPDLNRERVDPTIFERSFQRTLGLARLLVLERLPTTSARDSYLDTRRQERGRPQIDRRNRYLYSLSGNIKEEYEDEIADWVNEEEVSNYHTFTIPYGQRFRAKKIEKLCYTRDLLLNAEWNQPETREVYLHRHPAFFGRFEDVIHDCCGYCPVSETEEEKEIAEVEGKIYVSGKISFMRDDPGRQQIGSFNPLTDDDWTEMAYVGNTARLFQAIVDGDAEHAEDWLSQEGANPDTRDYTGRTPLHLAVMASTPEVVKRLVDGGARLVSRLADGRTALHLAASRGDLEILKIIMEKSVSNEAEFEEKKDQRRKAKSADKEKNPETQEDEGSDDASDEESDGEEDSDGELVDDDSDVEARSMATGSFVDVKRRKKTSEQDQIPVDDDEEPDFFDINVVAWDTPCTALHLAIIEGHEEIVKNLCQEYGADVLLPVKITGSDYSNPSGSLLTLVLAMSLPMEKAVSMVKLLLSLGATSSQGDYNGITAFQHFVERDAKSLLRTLTDVDQTGSKTAINHVVIQGYDKALTPLQVAVREAKLEIITKLLEQGAATHVDFESWLKAAKQSSISGQLRTFEENRKRFNQTMEQPLIVALKSPKPESAILLLERGADVNTVSTGAHDFMQYSWRSRDLAQSALDIVNGYIKALRGYKGESSRTARPQLREGLDSCLEGFETGTYQHWLVSHEIKKMRELHRKDTKRYEKDQADLRNAPGVQEKAAAIEEALATMQNIKEVMVSKGAKTFDELYPEYRNTDPYRNYEPDSSDNKIIDPYTFVFRVHDTTDVTEARLPAYIELFEAAWAGDIEKIKKLTLTSWDDAKTEGPLKIGVSDGNKNTPFSLAFFRGHFSVAKAILEIVQAQYSPADKPKTRYRMDGEEDYSDEGDSEDDESSEPRIYSELVGGEFTIEDVGKVSMKVDSRAKPLEFAMRLCGSIDSDDESTRATSPLEQVIRANDIKALKFLLDLGEHYSSQKIDAEDETSAFYLFPDSCFTLAVQLGRTELLAEIIRRTGAGLPLENLVKETGIELKDKPKYYQGLTVYGKKRQDWAAQGRNVVSRPSGVETSPLLIAAMAGRIDSVEWFLSDTPSRHYLDFCKSEGALADERLKHLGQVPGGVEGAISKWLGDQSDLVIHAAIMARPSKKSNELVSYLVKARPEYLDVKSGDYLTPLMEACMLGRVDIAKILIDTGADQSVKDKSRKNLLHLILERNPKAEKLEPFLALLDRDLLIRMVRERSSLEAEGRTPLHSFVVGVTQSWSEYSYDTNENMLKVFKVLLDISHEASSRALRMLDGSGDTPLHTAASKDLEFSLALTRAIVDFDPMLLLRENAVGRTPAEVAHDRFVAHRMVARRVGGYRQDDSVSTWPDRLPEKFFQDKETEKLNTEHEDTCNIAKAWRLCEETLASFAGTPKSKRRLVSLYEANDVAKRLGEKHMNQRYQFRVNGSDKGSEAGEEGEAKPQTKEASRRGTDVVLQKLYQNNYAWQHLEEDKKEEEDAY